MVKLFQCERNTFKNTRIFNWSKIRLVPCERNHRGFKAKKNLSWITNLPESAMISFHFLSVQMQKMFLLMKVIATAVLLTTVYLMKKGAYYLFIIIRSWKLVESFTRDPSIWSLRVPLRSTGKNRMTYWLKLFRTDGSHFKLHIKGRGDGCHSSLSFFLFPLSLRLRRMKTIFSSKCRFETSEAGFPNVTVDLRTFFYLNSWNNILFFSL